MAIGAYGIVNRIVFLFLMIIMGFNQGMQPIAGYNYGAKLYSRVIEVLKKTIFLATVMTVSCFVLGMLFPHAAVSLFTRDPQLSAISAEGLRITVLAFPIVGFQMVTSNFFQSLGLAKKAIFLSLSRQLLFLLPLLIILPRYMGTNGVWYSMPISDTIAAVVAAVMLSGLLRKFKKEMVEQPIINSKND